MLFVVVFTFVASDFPELCRTNGTVQKAGGKTLLRPHFFVGPKKKRSNFLEAGWLGGSRMSIVWLSNQKHLINRNG